jgi:DNA-binding LacI/PurR family transcriptional regulator
LDGTASRFGGAGRVRQADVARLARVSQTTVSLVLNGRSSAAQIPEDTRERVIEVAQRLGYAANPAARSLAGGRNLLLGVYSWEPVFPMDYRDFYYPFLLGIEEEAEASGYDLVLFTSASGERRRRTIYGSGSNRLRLTDGCIVLGMQHDREELRRLASEELPLVHIGRREVPGARFPCVTADYVGATAQVVERLLELGHRRLLYVGVPRPEEPQADRLAGFELGCRGGGLSSRDCPSFRLPTDEIDKERIQTWMEEGFTALVVEDGRGAQAIVQAAAEVGLAVPDDVSVAVLVDPSRPDTPSRSWSGFRVPRVEMGRRSVRLLVSSLSDEAVGNPGDVVLSCEPMVGATVAPPRQRPAPATRRRRP